ncbi:MAG: metal-dependent hydrolase [Solirubrobacteraceae bacterium MAG38_C4-C5]|nr:metal-dependent hydrolase [Candidatus Siliceabacter maunaloa]
MRNATHELVGVTCALGAGRVLGLEAVETAALGATALLGSWLPDADRRGTRVHRRSRLERRSLLAGALGRVARLPLVAFSVVARHRGITHSLFACALLGTGAVALGMALPAPAILLTGGLVVGYCAHVLADGCTPHGVQLWAPFSRRRVRLVPRRARIRTGSLSEGLLAAASGALALMLVVV